MPNSDKPTKFVTTEGEVLNHSESIPTDNEIAQVLSSEASAPDSAVVEADQANAPLATSFLSRAWSFPLIQDGLETVQYYADKTALSRFALEQAKAAINKAVTITLPLASPLTEKYKSQIDKVDHLGCQSLDLLENKFPIVSQHPSEILTAVKSSPQILYSNAKDRLTTTISQPIVFATENLESFVDKWLPAREQDKNVINDSTMTETKRLISLANQVKARVAYRLESAYSKADLHRLAETNKLLLDSTQSIKNAYNLLFETVKSFKGDCQTKSSEHIKNLSTNLLKRLDDAAQYMKQNPIYVGSFQPLLNPLVNFASHEYSIIRTEALKPDVGPLQKANNIMHLTQDYVLPLIQNSMDNIQGHVRHSKDHVDSSTDRVVNGAISDVNTKN